MGRTVFISYSSRDVRLAEEIDEVLRAASIDTWFAPRDVEGGAAFPDRILEGVQRSSLLVVLVTAGAAASRHVALELNLAVGSGKTILPLRVDHVVPSGAMQYLLGLSQWLDVERPLPRFAPRLTTEVVRLLDGGRPAARPEVTRVGPPSSVVQLQDQRDALVLGRCLGLVVVVHRSPQRAAALAMLPKLARKAALVAGRLGVDVPSSLFDPAMVVGVAQTADLITAMRPAGQRLATELEIRHDRRAAHAFELIHRITVGAVYVGDLAEGSRDECVRTWADLAVDVDLSTAQLDELAGRVRQGREPNRACLDLAYGADLFLEDRLLRETEFARRRASVWEMSRAIALAAAGRAEGVAAHDVDGLLRTAALHGDALGLCPPPLSEVTGESAVDSANALHYMLHTVAEAFVDDIESLYGQRTSALVDAAVKSTVLLILYGDEYIDTHANGIERALSKAAVPSDLWSGLVQACHDRATFDTVKDMAFRTRADVGRYLSDLVVMSRAASGG